MREAIAQWVEAMPGDVAPVPEVDGHPGLESCDPGADAEDPNHTGRSTDALYVPRLWGYPVAYAASRLDPRGAPCYRTAVLSALTFEPSPDPVAWAFPPPGTPT